MKTPTSKLAALVACAGVGAAAAFALAAAPAHATVAKSTYAVKVHFGDLDLNSDGGAQLLYLRLNRAARTVCGENKDPVYFEAWHAMRACERDALGQAVAELGRPKVTAKYASHFPNQHLTGARASAGLPDVVTVEIG